MTAQDPGPVTGLQLEVLRVLWRASSATVNEVHAALSASRDLAPTTVATLLKRLEKRGLVSHEKDGRQFRYRAVVQEEQVARRAVDEVAETVFSGDVTAFAAQLLQRKDVNEDDLKAIRDMLRQRERELKGD